MDKRTLKELIDATNEVENIYKCKNCNRIPNPCYKYLNFYCEDCIKNIKSPKHFKANVNHTRIISLLKNIEQKCFSMYFTNHTNKKNSKGETDLHRACQSRDLFKVRGLIALGAFVNEKDYANWTPLHDAIRSGSIDIVEELLIAGSCVNAPGDLFVTPLQKAIVENKIDIAKLLIKYGADVNLRNFEGLTALDYCTEEVQKNLLSLSKNKKLQVKSVTKYDNPHMKCVIFIAGSKDKQLKLMESALKECSFMQFSNKLSTDVTHVIVPDKVVDITDVDVITAILRMLPVVTYQWLESCAKEKKLSPLWPYYITGNNIFSSNVMDKLEENRKQLAPRLFDRINFYLSGSNELSSIFNLKLNNCTLSQLQIHNIIREGGGNILTREPHTRNMALVGFPWHAERDGEMQQCCHYVLYNKHLELKYNMKELRHMPVTWLLECVWNYKILTLKELKYDPGF